MSQIAVRLSEGEMRELDSAMKARGYRTRAEAVRAGIRLLGREAREERIGAGYRDAYETAPLTDDETQMLDAAGALAADLPR
jgi:Arc/MetJ-type ribon-helix-helix transcriptional regulator